MQRIAKFEKVSRQLFTEQAMAELGLTGAEADEVYDAIKLPKRATTGSAGYDFYLPCNLTLKPGQSIRIPTGIRVRMAEGWVLMIYPRSGLGFNFKLQLDNTVGVIDSDYYYSDNEGHMMAKLTNDSRENKTLELEAGKAFVQGVFTQFGITEDDEVTTKRNGGLGSTT